MNRAIVGTLLVGALALAGCGGSDEKVEIGVPAQSVETTSTTFKDSLVCIQDADSPCPSPSSATVPEEQIVCIETWSASDESVSMSKNRPECAQVGAQTRAAQSDLRNALTAEKVYFTDTQEYTADVEALTAIEPSLDWGGELKVVVAADEQMASPWNSMVCLSTTTESGAAFSIGDHASEGTWFGTTECPDEITIETLRTMGAW